MVDAVRNSRSCPRGSSVNMVETEGGLLGVGWCQDQPAYGVAGAVARECKGVLAPRMSTGRWQPGWRRPWAAMAKGQEMYGVSFGFKKCFNLTPHNIMFGVLQEIWLSPRILEPMQHMYANLRRRWKLTKDGSGKEWQTTNGILQGCAVPVVVLLNALVNVRLQAVEAEIPDAKPGGYADDIDATACYWVVCKRFWSSLQSAQSGGESGEKLHIGFEPGAAAEVRQGEAGGGSSQVQELGGFTWGSSCHAGGAAGALQQ